MNKKIYPRLLYWFVGILFVANLATLFLLWRSGQPLSGNRPPVQPGRGAEKYLVAQLKMTEPQQAAYKKLYEAHQSQRRTLHDSLRQSKDAFFDLLSRPGVNDSMLFANSQEAARLTQQEDILTFKHFQQVKALLTEEQKQEFDNIIKEVLRQMAPRPPARGNRPPRGADGPPHDDGPPPDRQEGGPDDRPGPPPQHPGE
jgi:Spy/CpxP family protein refolding chaperone